MDLGNIRLFLVLKLNVFLVDLCSFLFYFIVNFEMDIYCNIVLLFCDFVEFGD